MEGISSVSALFSLYMRTLSEVWRDIPLAGGLGFHLAGVSSGHTAGDVGFPGASLSDHIHQERRSLNDEL